MVYVACPLILRFKENLLFFLEHIFVGYIKGKCVELVGRQIV